MGIITKYGGWKPIAVKKAKSQQRDFAKIVADTIDEQIRILDGEEIRGTKKNKDGKYALKKSWRDPEGNVLIKIGIRPLAENKNLSMSETEFRDFLHELSKCWDTDEEIKHEFARVKKLMEEEARKKRETRATNSK
jgi:hypothetical protein